MVPEGESSAAVDADPVLYPLPPEGVHLPKVRVPTARVPLSLTLEQAMLDPAAPAVPAGTTPMAANEAGTASAAAVAATANRRRIVLSPFSVPGLFARHKLISAATLAAHPASAIRLSA